MNPITCGMAADLLPLYLDGCCSADSRAALEAHMDACPACRAQYAQLRRDLTPAAPAAEDPGTPTISRSSSTTRIHSFIASSSLEAVSIVAAEPYKQIDESLTNFLQSFCLEKWYRFSANIICSVHDRFQFIEFIVPQRWKVCNRASQQSNQHANKDHAAQRGRDAFGTATRISASLFRRLSVFFESTPDQGPKAAKFAVLPPGHAGFPKRVKQSEGSNSAPI